MKVEIENKDTIDFNFPQLMQSDTLGVIVLFVDKTSGVILVSVNHKFTVGLYVNSFDILDFNSFSGVVTLSNN